MDSIQIRRAFAEAARYCSAISIPYGFYIPWGPAKQLPVLRVSIPYGFYEFMKSLTIPFTELAISIPYGFYKRQRKERKTLLILDVSIPYGFYPLGTRRGSAQG